MKTPDSTNSIIHDFLTLEEIENPQKRNLNKKEQGKKSYTQKTIIVKQSKL